MRFTYILYIYARWRGIDRIIPISIRCIYYIPIVFRLVIYFRPFRVGQRVACIPLTQKINLTSAADGNGRGRIKLIRLWKPFVSIYRFSVIFSLYRPDRTGINRLTDAILPYKLYNMVVATPLSMILYW